MNSKQLTFFLTALETNSIAAAARKLEVTQPAISQQIAKLEESLDATLLVRDFRGVYPTEEGLIFAKHARNILREFDQAKASINESVALQNTEIKIGMMPSICNVLSIPLIDELSDLDLGISIDISTGPSYSLSGWLENNKIDLALSYEQAFASDFMVATPLLEEFMYLVVGTKSADINHQTILNKSSIPFWALGEFKVLVPGNKDALGKFIRKYEHDTGVRLNHDASYTGHLMTGLRQVLMGKSLAILPSAAFHHLEEQALVSSLKIIEPEMRRRVLAITHKNKPRSKSVIEVIGIIQSIVRAVHRAGIWRGELC
ncbi:LysR family transcriptional regulator [Glaciecola sp. KUL10]|uniref:LysR family transcriptional regulator n=1 Tax=Glaciecola sp. (strain KUL10) TaxID=2161813 RepID=UPI000D781DAD|nr:LysR family transcriptional regulator [Glaciecola sp. KUL10]GBL03957.1 transcriptional regulator, LysR family protein [Glaciecola sp. KUL10]